MNRDELHDLWLKYKFLPRKGWTEKGSRKKSNESIEVNRAELLSILDDAIVSEVGRQMMMDKSNHLETLLCEIADGKADAVECGRCSGIYRISWGEDCPYCEVNYDPAHRGESEGVEDKHGQG